MRALAILASLSLFALSSAPARAERPTGRPTWGGLGYMTQGWVMGDPSGLSESLGEDFAPGAGLVLGGGGLGLLAGRVVLGGNGYMIQGLEGGGTTADATYTGGGGGFHVGYAVVNDGNQLIFPFVGGVGHGGELKLRNGADPATYGGIDFLPGEARHVEGGGFSLDLGAALFHLPWRDDGGGPVFGARMGGWIPVMKGDWTISGDGEADAITGASAGLYFRMEVGGGGAFYK